MHTHSYFFYGAENLLHTWFLLISEIHNCALFPQLPLYRMVRTLYAIGAVFLLTGFLLPTAEGRKRNRGSQGAIPPPDKDQPNDSEQMQTQQQSGSRHRERGKGTSMPAEEVLESSQEALHITERKYLKRDWCKTQPLKQTIHEEGCNSRTIINRFCYGQCHSFHIPRHVRKEEGSFQSCSLALQPLWHCNVVSPDSWAVNQVCAKKLCLT